MKIVAAIVAFLLGCACAQAGASDSSKADALFKSGLAAAQAGNHDEAIATLRYLLIMAPNPRIKLELARLLYHNGKYHLAVGFQPVQRGL